MAWKYNNTEDWGWKKHENIWMPIQNTKETVEACAVAEKQASNAAQCNRYCSGETCTNIMEITKFIEENEFEEELAIMTPTLTPVIPQTFTFDVELESEP
ncbi:unnamed protein product [Pieris macdunnoughi]|uniref:Uncharacterized protein n=1 Tax=Pieris macdunnoughi TaxID=345717 RepID=A0A821W671_9NEOP|nr:unnamed protein product [Pieris macdunnoughi]